MALHIEVTGCLTGGEKGVLRANGMAAERTFENQSSGVHVPRLCSAEVKAAPVPGSSYPY